MRFAILNKKISASFKWEDMTKITMPEIKKMTQEKICKIPKFLVGIRKFTGCDGIINNDSGITDK